MIKKNIKGVKNISYICLTLLSASSIFATSKEDSGAYFSRIFSSSSVSSVKNYLEDIAIELIDALPTDEQILESAQSIKRQTVREIRDLKNLVKDNIDEIRGDKTFIKRIQKAFKN